MHSHFNGSRKTVMTKLVKGQAQSISMARFKPSRGLVAGGMLLAALMMPGHAKAVEAYGSIGVPGVLVGGAHPISDRVTLRADIGGIGSFDGTRTEDGVNYEAQGKFNRLGLFADWFALGNGFRLTGGLTVNQMEIDLQGRPEGGTITIGDNTYAVSDGDRFDARVEFPRLTPYLGIGWGHQAAERGWGFHADLGVSIGRAKVSAQAYGALATQPGIQDDINREKAELEDGVGKIRAIPQLTIGVSYRF